MLMEEINGNVNVQEVDARPEDEMHLALVAGPIKVRDGFRQGVDVSVHALESDTIKPTWMKMIRARKYVQPLDLVSSIKSRLYKVRPYLISRGAVLMHVPTRTKTINKSRGETERKDSPHTNPKLSNPTARREACS